MSDVPNDPGTIRTPAGHLGRRDLLRLGSLLAAGGLAALVPADIARADTAGTPGQTVRTTYDGHSPFGFDQWSSVDFDVPAGVRRISVSSTFDPAKSPSVPGTWSNMLDIGIFGPTGFRGWSGGARRDFTLSGSDATPGYVPGPIQAGRWSVALGPLVSEPGGMNWQIQVTLEYGDQLPPVPYDILPSAVPGHGAGWYRGDLHLHSEHSDGGRTVDQLVAAARAGRMDFIATSDHNTNSTGLGWHGNVPRDLLVINAEEVTTRHGHWLAVGLPQGDWIDWHYSPASGQFDQYAQHVRARGGLVVAAHPMTPGAGSFWEFGLDKVDAMEIWNGPWTLDDEANVALWHTLLFGGKRIPGLGNSDAHGGDVVGLPHNVVRASSLSKNAVLEALRLGRSYAAESADVTVDFTASAHGMTVGPGEELPVGVFDAVDVNVTVTGAPDTVVLLYNAWGIMASTSIGAGGSAGLHWRGWGKASLFTRAEVRRLKPAWTVLDQMVAVTNPIWFYNAPVLSPPTPYVPTGIASPEVPFEPGMARGIPPLGAINGGHANQATLAFPHSDSPYAVAVGDDQGLYLVRLGWNNVWSGWRRLAGPENAADFKVRTAAVTGMPDGTTQILATGTDGTLYHQTRGSGLIGRLSGFQPVPGPDGSPRWTAVRAAITGMPDGSAQVLAYGLDGALHLNVIRSDRSWAGWSRVPGYQDSPAFSGSALAVAAMADGSSEIVVIGLDGLVYHQVRRPDGTYTGFTRLPGVNTPAMAAGAVSIAGAGGTAHVVAVAPDGSAWHTAHNPDGSWSVWEAAIDPAVRSRVAGQVQVAVTPGGLVVVLAVTTS
ncbi:CehA/McbA family metallohydrolase [Kitasatospora sp. NPDC048540]|uniref:CehA/McbA family metallohydrolase n=1 Tax=Kitasatospora sp. NPDC048540 TaxID=3155634 RepID=UPI0033D01BAF